MDFDPYLFDDTLNICKFTAPLARNVILKGYLKYFGDFITPIPKCPVQSRLYKIRERKKFARDFEFPNVIRKLNLKGFSLEFTLITKTKRENLEILYFKQFFQVAEKS